MTFVIVTGNPVDGVTIYGPFASAEEAGDWAEGRFDYWWIAEVQPAKEGP